MANNMSDYIQKGTQAAEKAVEADKDKQAGEAARQYQIAAKWLILAARSKGMDPKIKNELRTKADSYISRAEKLTQRSHDPSEDEGNQPKPSSDGSSGKNQKSNVEDSDLQLIMKRLEGSIVSNPNVSFNDIVGLDQAKQALREAVILPTKLPKFFHGNRRPWSGILLYGPPGTGKSYLAKALATECKSTFIAVSSSDILSKWLGDSEKAVRCLFDLARKRRPCIIFIDEIDSLCSERNDSQSESSGRVKTEFLVQMQGVAVDNTGILVLGATNIPWCLDSAIRRRFEKRIYIPLPGIQERAAMLKTHLGPNAYHTIKDHEWIQLAEKSENYSGADIMCVCREALLRPIRRLSTATHFRKIPNPIADHPSHVWLACSPGEPEAKEVNFDDIDADDLCEPPVTMNDMVGALVVQRASVGTKDLLLHERFTQEFGQDGK